MVSWLSKSPSDKLIQYKDSKCAVLLRLTVGSGEDFNREFSNLTARGYELKTTYLPNSTVLGNNLTLGCYFYFQKLEKNTGSIGTENSSLKKSGTFVDVIEEQDSPKCYNCGNDVISGSIECKNCGKAI